MTICPIAEPWRRSRGHYAQPDHRVARGPLLPRPSREERPTEASATRRHLYPLPRDTGRSSWMWCRLRRPASTGGVDPQRRGWWRRRYLPGNAAANQLFEELINAGHGCHH